MMSLFAYGAVASAYAFGAGVTLGAFLTMVRADLTWRIGLREGDFWAWAVLLSLGLAVTLLWPVVLSIRLWRRAFPEASA
jgi:hypothetical protein